MDPIHIRDDNKSVELDCPKVFAELSHKNSASKELSLCISKDGKRLVMNNPIFGSRLIIFAVQESQVSYFTDAMQDAVTKHNEKIITNDALERFASQNKDFSPTSYKKFAKDTDEFIAQVVHLYSALQKKCELTLLEYVFGYQDSALKNEAREIISQSLIQFNILVKDSVTFFVHLESLLNDLKIKLEHVNHGLPNQLSEQLLGCLREHTEPLIKKRASYYTIS